MINMIEYKHIPAQQTWVRLHGSSVWHTIKGFTTLIYATADGGYDSMSSLTMLCERVNRPDNTDITDNPDEATVLCLACSKAAEHE